MSVHDFLDYFYGALGIGRENLALHVNGAEVYAFHLIADGEQVQRLRKGNKAAVTVCAEANALPTGDQLHYGFHFIERNYVLWRNVRRFEYLIRKRAQAAAAAEPIYWNYGAFIQQCVDFTILALCVFLMVKLMNRLMKKKEEAPAPAPAPEPPAPTKEELLLTEIRDLLKEQKK